MEDGYQSEEVMKALGDEILADPELKALVIDRLLEGKEFDKLEKVLDLSWHQDPSAFPPKRQPYVADAIRGFLEKKYKKSLHNLATMLAIDVIAAVAKEKGM